VDAATGAVLARAMLPTGLAVSDISVDPGRGHLYVSVAHLVNGGIEGNEVFEYDARSGRQRARLEEKPAPGCAGTAGRGDVAVARWRDWLRLKYFRCSGYQVDGVGYADGKDMSRHRGDLQEKLTRRPRQWLAPPARRSSWPSSVRARRP
jgi:hypothetical protein